MKENTVRLNYRRIYRIEISIEISIEIGIMRKKSSNIKYVIHGIVK